MYITDFNKRLDVEICQYAKDEKEFPYLPKMGPLIADYKNATTKESWQCMDFDFEIPGHPAFQVNMSFSDQYPFKPAKINIDPMPFALAECSVGSQFLLWKDADPVLRITHRILSIYSLITDELNGKGKGKQKAIQKLPEIQKLQDRQDLIAAQLKADEQFQDDLAKAIALSVCDSQDADENEGRAKTAVDSSPHPRFKNVELENMTFERPKKRNKTVSSPKTIKLIGNPLTEYFKTEKKCH